MNSSKKEESLSKAVLNVSTYKQLPGSDFAEARQCTTIDITDLLKEYDITSAFSVNGVCTVGGPYYPNGDDENEFNFVLTVSEPEVRVLCKNICDFIDVAIVNDKQNKAIKKMIEEEFDDFVGDHWRDIIACPEIKQRFDNLFDEAIKE